MNLGEVNENIYYSFFTSGCSFVQSRKDMRTTVRTYWRQEFQQAEGGYERVKMTTAHHRHLWPCQRLKHQRDKRVISRSIRINEMHVIIHENLINTSVNTHANKNTNI